MASTSHVYCTSCGRANDSQARFCAVCGRPIQKRQAPISNQTGATPIVDAAQPEKSKTPSSGQKSASIFASGTETARQVLKQRYQVHAQIGKGGFGVVHRAIDMQMSSRLVAIKEMSPRRLDPEQISDATEAFKREAYMLARLTHANLPSIYDYFTENGRWYLVMNFIEGETLLAYLRRSMRGVLPVAEVLQIGICLASVLDYLHSRRPPIIFRDLKPSNVMRTSNGHLYLIDFGIARHFKQGQATDTIALGSPGYASPEQYGKSQSSPQSDIYSLGAMMHHLLCGKDPSRSPFHFEPLQLPGYLELSTYIAKMLRKDPARRPVSMTDVRRKLEKIARQGPIKDPGPYNLSESDSPSHPYSSMQQQQSRSSSSFSSRPSIPAQISQKEIASISASKAASSASATPKVSVAQSTPTKKGLSRRFMLVGMAGIAGMAVGCGLLTKWVTDVMYKPSIATIGSDTALATAVSAPLAFTRRTPTSGNGQLEPLPQNVLAVTWLKGKEQIAAAAGDSMVMVGDLVNKRVTAIYAYRQIVAPVVCASWSPDTRYIASSTSNDTAIQIWDTSKNNALRTYSSHKAQVLALAWSPDGKRIASADKTGEIQVWEVENGKTLLNYKKHSGSVQAVAWAPDAKCIASGDSKQIARVWDAKTGEDVSSYKRHSKVITDIAWAPDGKSIATASQDGSVHVWYAISGLRTIVYEGHASPLWAVDWSPDGKRIACSSENGTIHVWKVNDSRLAYTYQGHMGKGRVIAFAWSADGKSIASGDATGTILVWEAG